MKRKSLVLLISMLLISSVFGGCGNNKSDSTAGSSASTAEYDNSYAARSSGDVALSKTADTKNMVMADTYEEEAMEADMVMASDDAMDSEAVNGGSATTDTLEYEDKLVYEANISIETLDFDATYGELTSIIESYGGRIESEQYDAHFESYTNGDKNRSGYHTTRQDFIIIRIPSKNYADFMASDEKLGNVIEKTQTLTNITQNYYDTKVRIELLEGQLEYYKHQLNLIEEKLLDCEDYEYVIGQMVEIEDRIISVQDQINMYTNAVKTMDMQVSYSTVYLNLIEVKEYTDITNVADEKDDTFVNRLLDNLSSSGKAFLRFLEGLLTMLIFAGPYIIIITVIAIVIVKVCGKSKKKKDVGVSDNIKKNDVSVPDDKKKKAVSSSDDTKEDDKK